MPIEITATPCRHGPPLSRPIVGDVVGFALGVGGPGARAAVDLRRHGSLRGRARGPATARCGHGDRAPGRRALPRLGAAALHDDRRGRGRSCARRWQPETIVPIHYEGWKHFREGRAAAERAFAEAPGGLRRARALAGARGAPATPERLSAGGRRAAGALASERGLARRRRRPAWRRRRSASSGPSTRVRGPVRPPGPASVVTPPSSSGSPHSPQTTLALVTAPHAVWRISAGAPFGPAVQRSPQAIIAAITENRSAPFSVGR